MPIATEIAILKLKADATIQDTSSPAHQKVQQLMTAVSKVKGYIQQFWGLQVEDATKFVWTIDWDDVSDHHNFMQTEDYKGFIEEASAIFDFGAGVTMNHVTFTSESSKAREAPATEFVTFLVASDSTEEQKSKVENGCLSVADYCLKSAATGFAAGWGMEGIDYESQPGGKALPLKAVIGWPSVEAHMKTRAEPDFATTAAPMRSLILPPIDASKMYHSLLTKF